MSQRTKVVGTRAPIIWLLIVIAVVAMAALAVGGLVIYPQLQKEQDAEQHYQAGIAFQDVRDWEAAEAEYKQVISIDANYKDVQTRLAEAKSKQQEALATVQAKAAQATATAQARAEATAAAATAEARLAQATSVATTATAQAMATVQAQEAKAAATAEARIAQATSVAATATAQARATVQAQEAKAAATAEALAQLEAHYQKGLGYINIGRWEEAKAELEQVFEVDPNYKEVQAKLAEVEAEVAKLIPTATSTPASRTVTVEILADAEWQNTGVIVKVGERVNMVASGTWSHKAEPYYGPEGYEKYDDGAPLPTAKVGSLIGRIGSGTPFFIGTEISFVANSEGHLQLSMNDAVGTFGNNEGSLTVQIEVQ